MQDYAILQLAGVKARLSSGSGSGLRASGLDLGLRTSDFGLRTSDFEPIIAFFSETGNFIQRHLSQPMFVNRNGDILT